MGILKPTLVFLQKLVMSRSVNAKAQNFNEIMQTALLHFHNWPRMISGQTFKLFSAFLERCEPEFIKLVLSLAVPCIVCLPAAEQEIARKAFQALRGPRLKAFLVDISAVAKSENRADVLQAYAQ